jgi:hypothetical protein
MGLAAGGFGWALPLPRPLPPAFGAAAAGFGAADDEAGSAAGWSISDSKKPVLASKDSTASFNC